MTETIFVQIREEVSHELCGCAYEDIPPEHEDMVDEEAYSRYKDWKQDEQYWLSIGREDRDNYAQDALDERLGL